MSIVFFFTFAIYHLASDGVANSP